jgi:hypothetical protein
MTIGGQAEPRGGLSNIGIGYRITVRGSSDRVLREIPGSIVIGDMVRIYARDRS